MRWITGLLVLALAMTTVTGAWAQPGPDQRQGPAAAGLGGGAHKQRVRMRVLQRRVGLDDATAHKVIEVLRAHEGRRRQLTKQIRQQKRALGQLIRQDSSDEQVYRRAIDELMGTHREMESLRLDEFAALRKVLTPKQQAKLLFELNRLMTRRQQRGGRAGPGGRGRGPHGPKGR